MKGKGKDTGAPPPPEMVGFHRGLNRETADNWAHFADHRARVTQLLRETGGDPASTLAILGAGNCNDLVLEDLLPSFSAVHLFDIDREALLRARDRLATQIDPTQLARLHLHAPVDLGGALSTVGRFRKRAATPDDLGALPQAGSRGVLADVSERFDLVASTCLLSQLVHGCQRLLGDSHPQIQEIACAIVVAHLRILVQLVKPGGTGILVTDVVSSDTYPLEELWGQKPAWNLIDELEATGNHLSGTMPAFVRRALKTDPVVGDLVGGTRLVEPWLWKLGPDEMYLVYGLVFARLSSHAP
jgi:hypothetical protein